MYVNKHIIFCKTVAKPRLMSLKLHGLIISVVQQIADALIFSAWNTFIFQENIPCCKLFAVYPLKHKEIKVQVHFMGKPVVQTLHQQAWESVLQIDNSRKPTQSN